MILAPTISLGFMAAVPMAASTAVASSTPTPVDLGTFGGSRSMAFDVSGDTVVGFSWVTGDVAVHAFSYDVDTKVMTDLHPPGEANSYAYGVSGDTVVGYYEGADGVPQAFTYDVATEVMTDLETPGIGGKAFDVDGDTIVGSYLTDRQRAGTCVRLRPSRWRPRHVGPRHLGHRRQEQ